MVYINTRLYIQQSNQYTILYTYNDIYTHTYIYTYVYRSIASSTVQLQKWPRPAMLLVAFGNSSASGYAASCACAPVGFGPLSQLQLEQRCETTNSRQVGSPQRNHGDGDGILDLINNEALGYVNHWEVGTSVLTHV